MADQRRRPGTSTAVETQKPAGWQAPRVGNSITVVTDQEPGLGWTGDWGMAASSDDKDFVHVLAARLGNAAGGQVKFMARNIANFEIGHSDYDIGKGMKNELASGLELVVVTIGENVLAPSTNEAKAKYAEAFGRLLTALEGNSHPLRLTSKIAAASEMLACAGASFAS
jgi:alpha-galactosidase